VMSLYALVFTGSSPIGNTFVGWLSDAYTVSPALILSGSLALILLVFTGLVSRNGKKTRSRDSAFQGDS